MSKQNRSAWGRLSITRLEDRSVPSSATAAAGPYAVGVLNGQTGDVVVYAADGTKEYTIAAPYGASFSGGVHVALADVNGDGTADVVTAPGAGTDPTVKVYDGAGTHGLLTSFAVYEGAFTGGVSVAAADLNADGKAEVVTGTDQGGGPRVRVFDGASVASGTSSPATLDDFLAINDTNFRGGVRVALGDVNGDGTPDLVVGAGFGGGPRVAVYDGAALAAGNQTKLVADFFAFEETLRNGVFPAVGDVNGDGCGDLIVGAGPGGAPRVLTLDGHAALSGLHSVLASYFAGSVGSRDGVEVSSVTNGSGTASVVGTDLQTGSTAIFDADGANEGQIAGDHHGGPICGLPPDGTTTGSTPTAVTQDMATALKGVYSGTAAGTLLTFTAPRTAPTSTASNATVSLEITSATLETGHHFGASSTASYGIDFTGTIAITLDGKLPVTLNVRGEFHAAPTAAGSPSTVAGMLHLRVDPGTRSPMTRSQMPPYQLMLDGTVNTDGTITVKQLGLADRSAAPTITAFRAPAEGSTQTATLTKA